MKELRKISEGMTGFQASEVIYGNDKELGKAIDACRKELDANKAYVAELEGEGSIKIDVAQKTGSGTTTVMSQDAVTKELDDINETLANTPKIAYSGEVEHIGELKVLTTAEVATQASVDGNGNSIAVQFSDIYNKIDGDSGVTSTISSMMSTMSDMQKEIDELKKKSWPSLEE